MKENKEKSKKNKISKENVSIKMLVQHHLLSEICFVLWGGKLCKSLLCRLTHFVNRFLLPTPTPQPISVWSTWIW